MYLLINSIIMKKNFLLPILAILVSFLATPALTSAREAGNSPLSPDPVDTRSPSAIYSEALKMVNSNGFINKPYKVTVPISAIVIVGGESLPAKDMGVKATLEIIPFGDQGNTVILDLDLNGLAENCTFSWSGKDIRMGASKFQGFNVIMATSGANAVCGGLAIAENAWMAVIIKDENVHMFSGMKKGMTQEEVKNTTTELEHSKFKYSRKSGNLDVYTLYWLGEEDHYDYRKGEMVGHLGTNKPFGDFYFDANGKLVKWIVLY